MPAWLRRAGCLTLSVLAGVTGVAALAVSTSEASKGYVKRIQPVMARAADAKSSGDEVQLDNVPYGYYIAQFNTATDQATILATTKQKDYFYLAVKVRLPGVKPFWECGWARSGAIVESKDDQTSDPSPCAQELGQLANRYSFGHGFNCGVGVCDGGTFVTHLTPTCNDEFWENEDPRASDDVITDSSSPLSPMESEGFYTYIGQLNNDEPVHYRYTTNDGQAAVIMSNDGVWGKVAGSCIDGYPQGGGHKPSVNQEVAGVVG